jgi:hypothetical protein
VNNILHFQIFRVILNVVNCKLKTVFILLAVFVRFSPPFPSTPGCRPLTSARFLCSTEKKARGVEMGGGRKRNENWIFGNAEKNVFFHKVLSRVPKL